MPSKLYTDQRQVLAQVESEYGVAQTPDGSNHLMTNQDGFELGWYEGDTTESNHVRESGGAREQYNVAPYSTISLQFPLCGSGKAGTPPDFGPLLRACGMAEMITEGQSVSYVPVSTSQRDTHESAVIRVCTGGGTVQILRGARGQWSVNLDNGGLPTITFTMTSLYAKPTAGERITPANEVVNRVIPVNSRNTVASVHGVDACFNAFNVSCETGAQHRDRVNCESVLLTGERSITGEITIDAQHPDANDFYAMAESHEGVTKGPAIITHGKTPGNIVDATGNSVQIADLSMGDDDGVSTFEMSTRYTPSAGDDEIALTFS